MGALNLISKIPLLTIKQSCEQIEDYKFIQELHLY